MEYINRLVVECLSEEGDSLEMKGRFIGDEGLEALMLADKLEDIENLDLSKNKITHRGIPHLINSDRLGKLKRLYLGENQIGDKGSHSFITGSLYSQSGAFGYQVQSYWA